MTKPRAWPAAAHPVADDGSDERNLTVRLRQAGLSWDAASIRGLVAGVLAAPPGYDPDAWMTLVTPSIDERVHALLAAVRAEAEAERDRVRHRAPALADRLASLRSELDRQGLNGFIVPRADEHQGEQVPACSERLAWVSGFTGSAGTAVVLAESAVLFVDGRYTEQAKSEVNGSHWVIHHSLELPLPEWIAGNMPAPARLGYDPWLHTPGPLEPIAAACAKAQVELVAVERNPVDVVWRDRPPPPISPIVAHEARFAGRTSAEKRSRAAESLLGERQDAAILAAPDSIAWLLNVRGGDVPYAPLPLAFAILHADARVDLFVDPYKLTPAVCEHLGHEVSVHPRDALEDVLRRLGAGGRVVRIDPASTPDRLVRTLTGAGATVAGGTDPCAKPKATKTPQELEGIRAAHRRDGAALTRFLAWLAHVEAGTLTEIGASDRLEEFRRTNDNYRGLSFPTISAAGPHGAIVHYRATRASDRRLEAGSLYLVDSGAQYLDGTTDVTRTVAIGEPTAEMRRNFTRVLKGHIAIATALFPKGTTGSQLDVLARTALWRAGLDYDHGTGHGVGYYLNVHEGPQRISKLPNAVALAAGMVVSNEPGYYRAGAYGIRIENLVAVASAPMPDGAERDLFGFETLTLAPIDLRLVEPAAMTSSEVRWLDAYHGRVRQTLLPLVDPDTGRWLQESTRPLGT